MKQKLITKSPESSSNTPLKEARIDTPLGTMVAIADSSLLYLLEFVEKKGLEREIEQFSRATQSPIMRGTTEVTHSIENELKLYFKGTLVAFMTPLFLVGSPFQKSVWKELQKIPSGKTRSYQQVATAIRKPTANRAVAQANGANKLVIIIPCHRVINANGELGGYSSGLERKKWLLNHELQ